MLKQLRMLHMLKRILQKNVLNQLDELEESIMQLVYLSNEQGSLKEYVHEPKLKFQLALANNLSKKLRT